MAGLGHAEAVVMNLLNGLLGCYRTVVVDNFFTSISLAKRLLERDTYLIGTLRSNRAGSGHKVVQKMLKRGEINGLQNKLGVKLIKWKDKRDVLMISNKPSHSVTVVNTRKTNRLNERIMKPQVVLDYNEGRQGTDLSDQLSTYHTCLRRSIKWYNKQHTDFKVSRKSCVIFTSWCTNRAAKTWSETTIKRSELCGSKESENFLF